MSEMEWIDMISRLYTNLHTSQRVMHSSKENDKRRTRLLNYFIRLEELHNKVRDSRSKIGEKVLKNFYYSLYVIRLENISESYFENQKRIARERGHGNIEITPEDRKQMTDQLIEDQRLSLEEWINYFIYDEESKSYGMWEKYWVFQGLQKLGKYDKEKRQFSKRDKTTVYPFPPLEREHVFATLHLMEEYLKSGKTEAEIKTAFESGNFKKIYEYVIAQSFLKGENQSTGTKGIWIKYDQGSDHNKLRNSLQGYYTGWCTAAGENFAKQQLSTGDFYVYYTEDESHEYKIPRIAIRMDGHDKIGEIRGIANNQNIEPEMIPILNEKLKEFPNKGEYLKKEQDMLTLTQIEKKHKQGETLTSAEIRFLYEIDNVIQGFGYVKDPRIEEVKAQRNQLEDFKVVLSDVEKQTEFNGNLNLSSLRSVKGLKFPKIMNGNLDLSGLTSTEGLELPEVMNGNLDLYLGKISTEGLKLPLTMNGALYLIGLTSAKGLQLPQTMNGYLYLDELTSTEGLQLPEVMNCDLYLSELTSAEGLELPEVMNGDLYLSGLKSAEGLQLPKIINGDLYLSGLIRAEGLKLPEIMNGSLYLRGLTSAEGLRLPQTINGKLSMYSLKIASGLELPQTMNDDLDLSGLKNSEGLRLPETMNGDLDLSGLKNAKGLQLPKVMNGYLCLWGLTSAKELKLPFGFDLTKLKCANNIKKEIIYNFNEYCQEKEEIYENSSHSL